MCDYATTTKYNLDTHIRGVHGKDKFQCDKCNNNYSTKWRFLKHVKKHQIKRAKKRPKVAKTSKVVKSSADVASVVDAPNPDVVKDGSLSSSLSKASCKRFG